MLRLAAFLGNPGCAYKRNRHNAGWMLAEVLPFFPALDWQRKYKGRYACLNSVHVLDAAGKDAGGITAVPSSALPTVLPEKFHFLEPQTYMNLSGEPILAAASFHKIKLQEIIVIHDEIELPLGTLSLKFSGGLGGHNGLRSMKACFGSADFWRLRIGIGRPDSRIPGKGGSDTDRDNGIADWVLSDFTAAEKETLGPVFRAGAQLLVQALAAGPEHLLPEWAKKDCKTCERTDRVPEQVQYQTRSPNYR